MWDFVKKKYYLFVSLLKIIWTSLTNKLTQIATKISSNMTTTKINSNNHKNHNKNYPAITNYYGLLAHIF